MNAHAHTLLSTFHWTPWNALSIVVFAVIYIVLAGLVHAILRNISIAEDWSKNAKTTFSLFWVVAVPLFTAIFLLVLVCLYTPYVIYGTSMNTFDRLLRHVRATFGKPAIATTTGTEREAQA